MHVRWCGCCARVSVNVCVCVCVCVCECQCQCVCVLNSYTCVGETAQPPLVGTVHSNLVWLKTVQAEGLSVVTCAHTPPSNLNQEECCTSGQKYAVKTHTTRYERVPGEAPVAERWQLTSASSQGDTPGDLSETPDWLASTESEHVKFEDGAVRSGKGRTFSAKGWLESDQSEQTSPGQC